MTTAPGKPRPHRATTCWRWTTSPGAAPLLSVIGGKITTYRRLAEAVLQRLSAHLPAGQGEAAGWTGATPLPGGEFEPDELALLATRLVRRYRFLSETHAARLARAYGTRASRLLGRAQSPADLGRDFGASLTEAEVRYLVEQEWARTAEDVVWRRSKLGLRMSAAEVGALDDWMRQFRAATGGSARRDRGGRQPCSLLHSIPEIFASPRPPGNECIFAC